MTYTFPKAARLLSSVDYERVFNGDKLVLRNRACTVLVLANGLGHPRLGLVVAKRKLRRSTDRNRFKRIVRESFRHAAVGLGDADVVVIAQSPAADLPNAELFALLDREWRKLGRRPGADRPVQRAGIERPRPQA